MSQVSAGVFGALAIALTLGAVQLASGRDLIAGQDAGHDIAASVVNRAIKSDRANAQLPRIAGRTFSLRLESLPDTSVLIRVPGKYRLEAGDRITKPGTEVRSPQVRRTVACEPVVSVLTEVAKQLQPGRCVT